MQKVNASVGVFSVTRKDFTKRADELRSISNSMEKWLFTTILVSSTAALSFVASNLISMNVADIAYLPLLISAWLFLFAMILAFYSCAIASAYALKTSEKYDTANNIQDRENALQELFFSAKQSVTSMPFFQNFSDEDKVAKGSDREFILQFLDQDTQEIYSSYVREIELDKKIFKDLESDLEKGRKTAICILKLSLCFLGLGFFIPLIMETYNYVC